MSIAILTAGLLLMDGLYFVESRTAVIDIYGTVFTMAALLSFAGYLTAPPERARWPLIQTGIFMGLGIATKWNAAYPSAAMALVALWRLSQLWRETRLERAPQTAWMGLREHVIGVPVGLVAIPIVEYVAAYVPFFLAGHSLSMFLSLQRHMLDFQVHFTGTFDYSSRWWEWPLALRPVWHGATNYADGRVANTYANGNPFLYWAFLPALFWMGLRWWRSRHWALLVLLVGFFGQWLPWVLVSRATFAYHFLPAVPFGCLAVATAVADLYRGNTAGRRTLAIGYVVLVVAAFAFSYPIYSFLPLSERLSCGSGCRAGGNSFRWSGIPRTHFAQLLRCLVDPRSAWQTVTRRSGRVFALPLLLIVSRCGCYTSQSGVARQLSSSENDT